MSADMMGWATLVAVLLGPILAVFVTRFIDERRADRGRKMDIFRTLMRTRKLHVHVDHVAALNLIEIEFMDSPEVMKAWKAYLSNLSEELPPIENRDRFEAAIKKKDSLLTKLLSEIAKTLKMSVEQIDILEGNYIPKGWFDDEWQQRQLRQHLIAVLKGEAALVVKPGPQQNPGSPYPPPPGATAVEPSAAYGKNSHA